MSKLNLLESVAKYGNKDVIGSVEINTLTLAFFNKEENVFDGVNYKNNIKLILSRILEVGIDESTLVERLSRPEIKLLTSIMYDLVSNYTIEPLEPIVEEMDLSFSGLTNIFQIDSNEIPRVLRLIIANIESASNEVKEAKETLSRAETKLRSFNGATKLIMKEFVKDESVLIDDNLIVYTNTNDVDYSIKITKHQRL